MTETQFAIDNCQIFSAHYFIKLLAAFYKLNSKLKSAFTLFISQKHIFLLKAGRMPDKHWLPKRRNIKLYRKTKHKQTINLLSRFRDRTTFCGAVCVIIVLLVVFANSLSQINNL